MQFFRYAELTIAEPKEYTMQAKNWIYAWVERRIRLRLNGRDLMKIKARLMHKPKRIINLIYKIMYSKKCFAFNCFLGSK